MISFTQLTTSTPTGSVSPSLMPGLCDFLGGMLKMFNDKNLIYFNGEEEGEGGG